MLNDPSHTITLFLKNCEIKCSDCEIEISDRLVNSLSQKNDEVFNFRKLFFRPDPTPPASPFNHTSFKMDRIDFPIDYLMPSIIPLYCNTLVRKIFKKIYVGGLAVYHKHENLIFSNVAFLLGKIFYCLDTHQNDPLLIEEFYKELLKLPKFVSYYEPNRFGVT